MDVAENADIFTIIMFKGKEYKLTEKKLLATLTYPHVFSWKICEDRSSLKQKELGGNEMSNLWNEEIMKYIIY